MGVESFNYVLRYDGTVYCSGLRKRNTCSLVPIMWKYNLVDVGRVIRCEYIVPGVVRYFVVFCCDEFVSPIKKGMLGKQKVPGVGMVGSSAKLLPMRSGIVGVSVPN